MTRIEAIEKIEELEQWAKSQEKDPDGIPSRDVQAVLATMLAAVENCMGFEAILDCVVRCPLSAGKALTDVVRVMGLKTVRQGVELMEKIHGVRSDSSAVAD